MPMGVSPKGGSRKDNLELEPWSTGVLECWQKRKPEFYLNWSSHYSITPQLHHSSRLPQGGKSVEARSGGSPKPGPLGPDFLLV